MESRSAPTETSGQRQHSNQPTNQHRKKKIDHTHTHTHTPSHSLPLTSTNHSLSIHPLTHSLTPYIDTTACKLCQRRMPTARLCVVVATAWQEIVLCEYNHCQHSIDNACCEIEIDFGCNRYANTIGQLLGGRPCVNSRISCCLTATTRRAITKAVTAAHITYAQNCDNVFYCKVKKTVLVFNYCS